MPEWFEDAQFWDAMSPVMFSRDKWERVPEEADHLVRLLGIESGAHVLDLCCGPGRHALELHRRGFKVTGVDLHAPYLEQARAQDAEIEWVHCDMREFRREDAFDAAINLFTSFGFFEDPDDDRRVARNVRASLKPGSGFLIDTLGKEVLARKFQPRAWQELDDGSVLLQDRRLLDGWRGVRTTWTLIRGRDQQTATFFCRLFAATELETLLREAGFGGVELYGWLDGRPYDHEARRLVALARA
ncbi:MAG: class I SAM-dependent DNA methyltransferase [Planctomycetota bacterium]|jgi:SAM-dependent methyltransferase